MTEGEQLLGKSYTVLQERWLLAARATWPGIDLLRHPMKVENVRSSLAQDKMM